MVLIAAHLNAGIIVVVQCPLPPLLGSQHLSGDNPVLNKSKVLKKEQFVALVPRNIETLQCVIKLSILR